MPLMDDTLYDLIWSILSYCLSKAFFFFSLVCLFGFGGSGGGGGVFGQVFSFSANLVEGKTLQYQIRLTTFLGKEAHNTTENAAFLFSSEEGYPVSATTPGKRPTRRTTGGPGLI